MHFTTDGTPLGTVSAEAWSRGPKPDTPAKRGSSEKRIQINRKPFEEKEELPMVNDCSAL